jgi:hypothetical protein
MHKRTYADAVPVAPWHADQLGAAFKIVKGDISGNIEVIREWGHSPSAMICRLRQARKSMLYANFLNCLNAEAAAAL